MKLLVVRSVKKLPVAISVLILLCTGSASALTQDQLNVFSEGIYFFNTEGGNTCSSGSSLGDSSPANGQNTPKWQTQLQPPYNLEDFVVEVLRDIAAKEGVPESDTVTPQHVLALIAFAYGEGGNLTNNDIYNPWNTGYSAPDLQPATDHHSNGTQSYSSFNDGVEAVARVMTGTGGSGGYQSRLGAVLKDPSTTAQEFMKTLTYYQNYTGNLEWAEASMPPNQDSYYQGRLDLIKTVTSQYQSIASSVIGPPGNSYNNNQHTTKPLRYSASNFASNSGGGGDVCGSVAGAVQGSIVKTALNFAWDDYPTHNATSIGASQAKPGYVDAVAQYEGFADPASSSTNYSDCGVFVATVMKASGVDPNYTASYTPAQLTYVQNHPDKYTVLAPGQWTTADVQPGDIFISNGHTYIYVGKQSDGFSVAEASQTDHVPEVDADVYTQQTVGGTTQQFYLVRVKGQ